MKNYIQHGDTLDLIAPSGGVVSGSPVKIGDILVVPQISAAEGEVFTGKRTGVILAVKYGAGSGQAWAQGETVYWDNTNKRFTKTSTDNLKAGVAVEAALTAATEGKVLLLTTI